MDQIKTDLSLMRRLTKFGPWAAITTLICLVAMIITPIWLWEKSVIAELRGNHLSEIGLVATPTETGQILSWDLTKLKLHECQQGAKAVPCLIRVGRP